MNKINVGEYSTIVFDCDGVVLNSNAIKTRAFYNVASLYGKQEAEAFVDYHQKFGGISRYEKFKYFLQVILNEAVKKTKLDEMLTLYAKEVRENLLKCEVSPALSSLRDITSQSKWLIASGGDQAELRDVFYDRDLSHFFNGGIFGSPDCKESILVRELASSNIQFPALLIGDSKYDFLVAEKMGLDFLFVSAWTDFFDWKVFQTEKDFSFVSELSCLI